MLHANVFRLAAAGLELLYPPRCAGCSKEGRDLCDACRADLPYLLPPYCIACSQPLSEGDRCARCTRAPLAIDGFASAFRMEGAARAAVLRLKYSNARSLAPTLAALMIAALEGRIDTPDLLLPVPLHPKRERSRGYNQASLLTREVGKAMGVPVLEGALARGRNTPSLTRAQNAEERRAAVAGAFVCIEPAAVAGMRVAVLDDVCTTGATPEACAVALQDAGAVHVQGITLAREA